MSTAEISELLQHASWVRRLARSLVRDDAAADDLVQETWMAALRSPPRAGDTVRPWLAEVLRNVLRAGFRSDARRARRHEAVVDKDASAAAADQLVEAVELQRELALEVLGLDEPYRSTVLLRFYEELNATEIGERLQVPAATVRWRLKAALAELRARLDRKHAGGRAAWLRALTPLTTEKLIRASAAKGFSLSTIKGEMAMKLGVTVIAVGAVGALAVLKSSTNAQPPQRATAAAAVKTAPQATPSSPSPAAVAPARERLDAGKRADMLRRIAEARRVGHVSTQRAAQASGDGELDKEYIRGRVRELIPLIQECYENALRTNPTLGGRLMVSFSIVGDPSVGGLVANSTIDDEKSTIGDKPMRECVQETMYAAKFAPPSESGEVKVEYPFVFRAEDSK
jgi:RNA polymerase sigma-70 factor (ECF subfamily)